MGSEKLLEPEQSFERSSRQLRRQNVNHYTTTSLGLVSLLIVNL